MGLNLSVHTDARSFLSIAGEMLYSRETVNNLMLGVSERLTNDPDAYENPFFATLIDEKGVLQLAAVMTPPHNVILAGWEDFQAGVPVLIDHLQSQKFDVPGIIGPVNIVEHFVSVWKRLVRQPSEIAMHQRVYELRSVSMPPLPSGKFRQAFAEETHQVSAWFQAFEAEALAEGRDPDFDRTERLLSEGQVFVWDQDREIVSMALKTRPIAHSITISGVYTPPEHRQHGYASALVAHLSQKLLDDGFQFVNLFTDLSNPTSNHIYETVGFHPICDFRMYQFITERSI